MQIKYSAAEIIDLVHSSDGNTMSSRTIKNTKVPRKPNSTSKLNKTLISNTDNLQSLPYSSNVPNRYDYYMNEKHKTLRDNAVFNTRHSHSRRSSFLSQQTSQHMAHKNSLTVDRYFSLPRDSHVGPSSNHYTIPTVPTVQSLNIIDSETVLVTPISNSDIFNFMKLIFNFSIHEPLKLLFAKEIKEHIRNEWYNRFPSKSEIHLFLSHTLRVYPQDFNSNPRNSSACNYDELVERIYIGSSC